MTVLSNMPILRKLWHSFIEAHGQSRFDAGTFRRLIWAGWYPWYPGRCVPLIGWENSLNAPGHSILSEFGRLVVQVDGSESIEIDYIKDVDCGFDGTPARMRSVGLCPIAWHDCISTWFVDRSGAIYSDYGLASDLWPIADSFDEALSDSVNRRIKFRDVSRPFTGYRVPSGWGSVRDKSD